MPFPAEIILLYMGMSLVSTGVWKPEKRAAVCPVCVKKDTLNINAKKNNNFAPMAMAA